MTILIILIILVAIPFVAAVFLSKHFAIEREITINRPNQEVFDFVKHLKNNVRYNKWTMTDPNVKLTYTGTDGTVGFIAAWDSTNKNVGQGEQEIVKIEEGRRVDFALRFVRPFENTAGAYFITEPLSGNQTKVRWVFTGDRNYANRIMHFVLNLKKMLGNDLQTSLNTMKQLLEK